MAGHQRWISLRPGDRPGIERLLALAGANGDASRLMEASAWLLSRPQPATWAAGVIAQALRTLSEIDSAAAAVVARRALDVLGPKETPLRVAMLLVADRAYDDAFAATVLERWLAFCPESPERAEVHLRLAGLRRALGDAEGEARTLVRAVRAGATGTSVETALSELADAGSVSPDTELWTVMARAERLAAVGDPAAAAAGWRDLGAALWDLADDREGAMAAWDRAFETATADGPATLALDLLARSRASTRPATTSRASSRPRPMTAPRPGWPPRPPPPCSPPGSTGSRSTSHRGASHAPQRGPRPSSSPSEPPSTRPTGGRCRPSTTWSRGGRSDASAGAQRITGARGTSTARENVTWR